MKSRITPLLIAIALGLVTASTLSSSAQVSSGGATREVVVLVERLRNDRGIVVGALYASQARWLVRSAAVGDCRARIHGGVARCTFTAPAGAAVAFAGFHDEDEDEVFDRDFFGFPQEGYAFSNDARDALGPPSFHAASFTPPSGVFVVHARYGI